MLERRIIRNLKQGTSEWLRARSGIPTASEAECLLVKGKAIKGVASPHGFGAGAQTYARDVAGEILLGGPMPSYQSKAMELGSEYEDTLRDEYSLLHGVDVEEVGIVHVVKDGNVIAGYSPDGFIGKDGLAEIKTRAPKLLIGLIMGADLPSGEYVQGQFGLWATGRSWIDHIAGYPGGIQPHIRRICRDEEMIEQIEDAVVRFNIYVSEILEAVKNAE
jgi:predicted phage-related endonuclease